MPDSRQARQDATRATGEPRVAVVTGAAMGLGRAIAVRLAADGHAVVIADVAPSDETQALIRDGGGTALRVCCDVTSPESVQSMVQQVRESLGSVDVLVANAGIYPIAPFLQTDWRLWRRVMDINVDGVYHVMQAVLPEMVEHEWGRVIALVSGAFHTAPPGFAAYSASKGAVIGLVRSVAAEVGAAGVTVNAITPSITPTPGVDAGPQRELGLLDMVVQAQAIKRQAVPEDVVGAISFLASDDAGFISGQTLAADGGATRL